MKQTVNALIVEDDPGIRAATARVLRTAGHTVTEAASGEACLAAVREQRPDLVLLDVILPDADGVDLCRRIKTDPEFGGTYVVLISGTKTLPDDQAGGLEYGADGYIVRPIANRELAARVASLARIIRAERERDRLITELRAALAEIKILSGLLPICSHCKKIRDDRGYWNQLEAYITAHSDASFTHGICPACAEKYYPEENLYDD